ncbi:hypothetical protein [Halalkalibacter krulwichiae]|uniref:GTP-binding protein YsxC n=1 Tax=Halalkalibacter krulwichiae TaxID=199441 RepID=A0A1X9M829_9BACI|nr:hypothetical protein [Halalkalibacter krulwichiae]ARK29566.1 GTP-binding protein YsxC [Halalkalibacter krulwichiae]
MNLENELIQKKYYKRFLKENEKADIVEVLADTALTELKNELPDLSSIRFSQGEVYYHYKDYEAAIFKWENIHNDLQPWAKKNMADAYYELGMLQEAKDIYLSIEYADDLTLHTEVFLQLFSLYMEQQQLEKAAEIIKNTVELNPDYPNVTAIARSFFEEYRDYSSVVDLAVNEALRTGEIEWFDALNGYVKQRFTKTTEPSYFTEVIVKLATVDQNRTEQLILSFWKSYQNGPYYFDWIMTFNDLFEKVEENSSLNNWIDLSKQYHETYSDLIGGTYYINEIKDVIPSLLSNWLKVSHTPLVTASAVLAWEETFPSSLDDEAIHAAEALIKQTNIESVELEQSLELFESIEKWAVHHQLEIGYQLKWIVQQLIDEDTHHVLVAGTSGNGRSSFINEILGHSIVEGCHANILFRNDEQSQINKVTDANIEKDLSLEEFQTITALRRPSIIDFKMPSPFLRDNHLSIIHAPSYNGEQEIKDSNVLHIADGLLFVLSANTPFTDEERKLILNIQQLAPNLPIHFILNKIDVFNEQEATRILEETSERIHTYFPNANVLAFSSRASKPHLRGLNELVRSIFANRDMNQERKEKRLLFIRKTITHLLQKRVEMENERIEAVHWYEEAVTKLNGAIHQLEDVEKEKIQVIKQAYHSIKIELRRKLKAAIPSLLKECSSLVNETSDFRKLHLDLNQEMNRKIHEYIADSLLPDFQNSIQQWLEVSNVEFIRSQSYLNEMSEGFNALYGEERFKMSCDFRVLDDWHRDIDRMTTGVHLDDVNVLLRLTPSQLLLKSSGKLFGALPSNKNMILNMYKKFIQNENYEQVTETITNQFMMQFELFEKGLERDISMSFRSPFTVLNETVKEAEMQIDENNEQLRKLKANPEIHVDPLTLFKLKLRQFELMEKRERTLQLVY